MEELQDMDNQQEEQQKKQLEEAVEHLRPN
jgi:hypothetical protein